MKLTVLGAGSWGLTLTWLLNDNFDEIALWSREEDLTEELVLTKSVKFPLEVQLDNKAQITSNLEDAIKDAQIILVVVATSAIRSVCQKLKTAGIKSNQILVNASKGLELPGLFRMSEIFAQELPNNKFAVLSGPTLAAEVLKGQLTAASIACEDMETANFLQKNLAVTEKFRLYSNADVIGVELGGSLKNVIAIASGFIEAMKLGDNAKGTLMARGLAEIVRVSVALGANPSTLYGLSGVGDLFATCNSPLSRNFRVGYMLGQGKKLDDILKEIGAVAEGVKTSKAMLELSKKLGIETPLSAAVYEAVYTNITPEEIVSKLMSRKLKPEDSYKLAK
ncbi:MAG TPA: NAD(P)H-dependent glycerol-3-phosphate dehydrogenase [Candidatus Gastranaerophilales bacterium]|nr:NAD(P)H-dependent glycerol-3-phosphate dehydrogenase [Candidatus Gastranaerophilales bacterium]